MQWGAARIVDMTVGGGETRKTQNPNVQEVSLSLETNKTSPALAKSAVSGKSGPAVIHLTQTFGDQTRMYYEIKLDNCMISSYNVGAQADSSSDSVTLAFTKIEWRYIPHDKTGAPGGAETALYDLALGTSG